MYGSFKLASKAIDVPDEVGGYMEKEQLWVLFCKKGIHFSSYIEQFSLP